METYRTKAIRDLDASNAEGLRNAIRDYDDAIEALEQAPVSTSEPPRGEKLEFFRCMRDYARVRQQKLEG